jgi:AAA15 family ATPase/GTPase
MVELHHFVRVDFCRFKAFDNFILHLRHFNILVGPNNAGKSTILAAFRILAAAMRKASTRKSEPIRGPQGLAHGYAIDLSAISIAEENISITTTTRRLPRSALNYRTKMNFSYIFPSKASVT